MLFAKRDYMIMASMFLLAVAVTVVGKNSLYSGSKAYETAASGVRIEAEEMSLTGAVSKDASGTFIVFGP